MPPNKKKKKPASNPARGFTTVSVPSKQKSAASSEAASLLDTPKEAQEPSEAQSAHGLPEPAQSGTNPELHKLSPEELERHLEEAELQSLVEKYGSKCKNDASRQVTKLDTERRVLRSQAQHLLLTNWLSSELLSRILDKGKIELEKGQNRSSRSNVDDESKPGTDDESKPGTDDEMCAKIWTLQRTLSELGFPKQRVDEALKGIDLFGSDDLLDQALEWLATYCDESELPKYEERKSVPKSVDDSHKGESQPVTPGSATPQDNGSRTRKPTTDLRPIVMDSGSDDSDFSDSPQSLIPHYVSLKSRLYEVQPSLFNGLKKKTKKPTLAENENVETDRKVQRLRRKLAHVENDVLFDHQQAESRWQAKLAELRSATAESSRQNLGREATQLHLPGEEEDQVGNPPASFSHEDRLAKEEEEEEEEEQEGGILGSIFDTEPDDSAAENAKLPADANTTTKLRDFGKSTGTSPRRVLEEACRARDSGHKIKYQEIFSAPHSHRHRVEISWSKTQDVPPELPLEDVSCAADSRSTTLSMVSVSTPTSQQSEFYISVVALFTLFSHSPKESRVYMRLPAPWRDLWTELAEAKKYHEDKESMEVVKHVKGIIEENRNRLDQDVVLSHNFKKRNGNSISKQLDAPSRAADKHDSEELKRLWADRTSSGPFKQMIQNRQSLPIWAFRQQILDTLATSQAMIICSETGSGKSTQIPSFILENELVSGHHCKIYVTEPRRISAISLAKRVSEELGEGKNALGSARSLVGYSIRLESKVTPSTRLVYATTGVVIRMLERPQEIQDITHLVLDEVHERTIDSDFLLIILRRLLKERPSLKLVLMSATVDARRFSSYLNGAPILDIPGRTFPVEVRYLEDAIELSGYRPDEQSFSADTDDTDEESPARSPQEDNDFLSDLAHYSKKTRDVVSKYDEYRMDYKLIISLLSRIATSGKLEAYSKAILVFMPGLAEISRLHDEITSESTFSEGWVVYSLHSSIATQDQEKAFVIPPRGVRKIVIATNIAETGITIPDITAVVDTGKEKVMRFDEKRQISRLTESFISRANAKQRRGRAGRVQNGICFHLFTKSRHDNILSEQQTPEMLRLSLQDLILRVKICNLGEIEGTLAEALDPPSAKNVRRAIEALKEVKALTEGEALTSLGKQLARLPLDVFLGKLILYGTVFKCLDAAVSIAAILSCKSPFVTKVGSSTHKDLARRSFSRGDSDLLTLYNAYCAWKRCRTTLGMNEFAFCKKNSLSPQALLNIEDVKTQLIVSIVDIGLLKLDSDEHVTLNRARFTSRNRQFFTIPAHADVNGTNDVIVNSVIAWSFYPRLLTREGSKKGWRNVSNNQAVTLHPTSVNKGSESPVKWLSYYHIMQSRNRNYNAHETSAVEDIAVALLCGDVAFKMYAGVVTIDGSRIRFSIRDWKTILAFKILSTRIREILSFTFREPKKAVLSLDQKEWLDILQQMLSPQERQRKEWERGRTQGPVNIR